MDEALTLLFEAWAGEMARHLPVSMLAGRWARTTPDCGGSSRVTWTKPAYWDCHADTGPASWKRPARSPTARAVCFVKFLWAVGGGDVLLDFVV